MSEPEMESVVSDPVDRIGYDEESQEVYVEFSTGVTYVYSGVPPAVYEDFRGAASIGSYVNTILKATYPYRRL
jgi:hypothetical protein